MSEPVKHTPGPWRARRTAGGFAITAGFVGGTMLRIAFCEDGEPETEADANLIAAAPDMFAILKVYAEFDNCSNVDDRGTCTPDRLCVCCRARAAVAKAEGR